MDALISDVLAPCCSCFMEHYILSSCYVVKLFMHLILATLLAKAARPADVLTVTHAPIRAGGHAGQVWAMRRSSMYFFQRHTQSACAWHQWSDRVSARDE